jgi:hypothetical protein
LNYVCQKMQTMFVKFLKMPNFRRKKLIKLYPKKISY